ncbi:cytochrome c oxidase subunit II [Phenylobacterium sp.]|jgi:cytochrome c oxidase subunit 2|uniref:cytochrome c oxidase subunit II n=1 Tax=Phenylobacterium sp. TaxID=1871053 RepID=UPI002E375E84|nr:cytochrome c oxidase subunit II [Phenylobacterium sp.]HEX3365691.1 cytochrome c oxidase subunit II [Phenylobacterium sp.]
MGAAFSLAWPMTYLKTYGPRANPITGLTWGLMDLSLAVIAIITVLVVAGVWVRRERRSRPVFADLLVGREAGGLRWIWIGLGLTIVALVASLAWTVAVMAAVGMPGGQPALTLEITGHQWWWEVRYVGATPNQTFVTANEIHVPTGRPVLVKLNGADVIHSFWIPALAGKTDAIPGRTNLTWLQADRAGVYRGQCTEYCGVQHANMAAFVTADPPAVFEAWRAGQLRASVPAASPGKQLFVQRCGACHTVRGGEAGGVVGPDLTHLMSRRTLAAGTVPNTPDGLSGWISNPQALKPGARMPATDLSGPELGQVVAYLETLT